MVQVKDKKYYSVRESASRMGIAVNTLRSNWIKYNLKPYNYGSRLFFDEIDLDNLLESRMKPGRPKNAAIGTIIGDSSTSKGFETNEY